jgi:hypothetical protein
MPFYQLQQVLCLVGILGGLNVLQSFATRPILMFDFEPSNDIGYFWACEISATGCCASKKQVLARVL